MVRESSMIFIQVKEKLSKTNYLVSKSLSLTIGMVFHKVIALIVVSKYDLSASPCEITSIMCITYLLGSIFFTSCCKYVKWGSRKKWLFLTASQGIVREFCFTHWV